ncbi:hypothetical protein FRB95_012160 [Tulasnella sp. JGI-2019a]|nr:hypothetical protein FRB93_011061 [Tulasnella sp. JGI-2019a]KAG9024030.1 hypothetical protein FRB95_012160 [Tulasnella sp. JGI-2019a]
MFTFLGTNFTKRSTQVSYHTLPTSSTPEIVVVSPHGHCNVQQRTRRRAPVTKRTWAAILVPVVTIYFLSEMFLLSGWRVSKSSDDPDVMYTSRSQVPDYADLWDLEEHLPQQDLSLPQPEGRNGRFLKFEWTYTHLGFNNQLQDVLMTAHLAYLSNRAYTIQPYIWNRHSLTRVVVDKGHLRSAQIPLSAFISGPAAGTEIENNNSGNNATVSLPPPRAVTRKFFDQVCPSRSTRIRYVDVDEVRVKYGIEEAKEPSAAQMLEAWSKELGSIEDSCVVVRGKDYVFPFGAYGHRLAHAWPHIKDSPVFTQHAWSPLVEGIVRNNLRVLAPDLPSAITSSSIPRMIPGLLAIHLRRGDFARHCGRLGDMGASFAGWANIAGLPDPLQDSWDKETTVHRCFPTVGELMKKIRTVRQEWEASVEGRGPLNRVYVLTNAEVQFREDLTSMLIEDGWDGVTMSTDLEVRREEKEVAVAADMMVAQVAEVFLGNGWSSLTSNVNLMRMLDGAPIESNRFL